MAGVKYASCHGIYFYAVKPIVLVLLAKEEMQRHLSS